MNLAQRIQAKTDNGDSIIDFLLEVMNGELDSFKPCHRLDAAKLLVKYERDEALDFILDNPPEPPRHRTDSSPSDESYFDKSLARVIRESTDDGASVCRFLINVMEGDLSAFKPHHRISAARELLDRGFGRSAREEAAAASALTSSATPDPQSHESPNHTNHSSDNHTDTPDPEEEIPWAEINELIDAAIERSDRIMAEQEPDPDNPPHVPDYSAFDEAQENSQRWFEEWKNSIDPDEYQAIITETAERFDAKIDRRIERRKQIAEEREQRAKDEAERLARQAEAKANAESEEPPEPGPPTRSQHRRKLMFVLGDSIYVDCEHPDCDLHDEDRSRWRGSVQYGAGPATGYFP